MASAPKPQKITLEVTPMEEDKPTVAELAYQFWLDRGSPIGSPEEDWFRAEGELNSQQEATAQA